MNLRKHSLLEGDVAPHLRRLSLPLAAGMLSLTLFSLADTYFISHLGTGALAALSFTLPVVMFFQGVAFGLSVGTAAVIARVYGEGDFDRVRQMSTDALVMAAIVLGAAALVGLATMELVFPLMGAKDDVMPLIRHYMWVWYAGLPFFGLMIVGNACMRALGETGYASMIMTMMSLVSLILDPLFIYGWGPFPALGLPGAALAVCVGCSSTCVYSLYSLARKRHALSPVLWHAGSRTSWRRFMHIALPSMLSNQVPPISAAIITWMAAGYGKEAVAALGVAGRIEGVCVLVFYAIAAGVSIFTGQNFGAGNYGRIGEAIRLGQRWTLLWGLVIAAVLWVFAYDIPAIFDSNPRVVEYAAQYLHWVPVSFGALGIIIVVNAALNAMARPLSSTMLIMLRVFVLYVPMAFVLQGSLGFMGIVVALCVTNLIVGGVSVIWQRRIMP